MALPPSLIRAVENHGCMSGCYSSASGVQACVDPLHPAEKLHVIMCSDCYAQFGVLAALTGGLDSYAVADWITQHLRASRGYSLSFGGYHARGTGFYLSGALFGGSGLFLLDGHRSSKLGTDLDLLIMAFKQGVAFPPDPGMLDPARYATEQVYVQFTAPFAPIKSKADLLASPHCRRVATKGFMPVTVAEFQPVAATVAVPPPAPRRASIPAGTLPRIAAPAPSSPGGATKAPVPAAPKVGEVCPTCGAVVCRRQLLNQTFVGCLC